MKLTKKMVSARVAYICAILTGWMLIVGFIIGTITQNYYFLFAGITVACISFVAQGAAIIRDEYLHWRIQW